MEGIIVNINGFKIPKLPFEVKAYKRMGERFDSHKWLKSRTFFKPIKTELKISKQSSVLNY